MAKTVTLQSDVSLNDVEYNKGTTLSVSDEIAEDLLAHGLATVVEPKAQVKKP